MFQTAQEDTLLVLTEAALDMIITEVEEARILDKGCTRLILRMKNWCTYCFRGVPPIVRTIKADFFLLNVNSFVIVLLKRIFILNIPMLPSDQTKKQKPGVPAKELLFVVPEFRNLP